MEKINFEWKFVKLKKWKCDVKMKIIKKKKKEENLVILNW